VQINIYNSGTAPYPLGIIIKMCSALNTKRTKGSFLEEFKKKIEYFTQ
jgi:hypothetical protein